jgi:hypothetical protein
MNINLTWISIAGLILLFIAWPWVMDIRPNWWLVVIIALVGWGVVIAADWK